MFNLFAPAAFADSVAKAIITAAPNQDPVAQAQAQASLIDSQLGEFSWDGLFAGLAAGGGLAGVGSAIAGAGSDTSGGVTGTTAAPSKPLSGGLSFSNIDPALLQTLAAKIGFPGFSTETTYNDDGSTDTPGGEAGQGIFSTALDWLGLEDTKANKIFLTVGGLVATGGAYWGLKKIFRRGA